MLMDPDTIEILSQLQIIGSLKVNQKLSTGTDQISAVAPTWFKRITRWFRGETRSANLNALHTILNAAFDLARDEAAKPAPDSLLLSQLTSGLRAAEGGLDKLALTYKTDAVTTSKLEIYRQYIAEYLKLLTTSTGEAKHETTPAAARSPTQSPPPPRLAHPVSMSSAPTTMFDIGNEAS
jgi:hypothetical protein